MTFKTASNVGIFSPLIIGLITLLIIFHLHDDAVMEKLLPAAGYAIVISIVMFIPYCFYIVWVIIKSSRKTTRQLKRYSFYLPIILLGFTMPITGLLLFIVSYFPNSGDDFNIIERSISIFMLPTLTIGGSSVLL